LDHNYWITQEYVAYYQYDFELSTGITLGNGFSLLAPYIIMFVILVLKLMACMAQRKLNVYEK